MPYRRLAIVFLLTMLPWPAVWYGMYVLSSIVWSFFLYHFVCLLPAIVWGWPLWNRHIFWPTKRQWLTLAVASLVFCLGGKLIYDITGELIIDRADLMNILTKRGWDATWLLPLSFYFVLINATLEELFWRGVVLNELEYLEQKYRFTGMAWTAITFAAWHYLVFRLLLRPVWAEIAILSLVAVGVFVCWLYRKTQSLVLPILWHAFVFDLAIIIVFVAVLQKP